MTTIPPALRRCKETYPTGWFGLDEVAPKAEQFVLVEGRLITGL